MRSRIGIIVSVLALVVVAQFSFGASSAGAAEPDRVYFPQTGHTLSYGFLQYWLNNGAVTVFGYPISEERNEQGVTVQYFERAVFEWHPEAPPGWQVQLRRLGSLLTAGRMDEPAFRPVQAQSDAACEYFPQTQHRLCNGFRSFWNAHGGVRIFGYPISEELTEEGRVVQYFERARFEWWPELAGTPYEIQISLLGRTLANANGVDTAPVPQSADTPTYDPALWLDDPTTVRVPPPGAPVNEPKWVEVDLSHQYLRAWEYGTLVFGTYVSTGVPAHPTPTGMFRVYRKLPYDDMQGGTPGIDYYYLPRVPDVLYFLDGYALHGTYWHHNFGHVMSHGCVNLPLDAAAWIYSWAPVGTLVWIHQ